MAKLRNFDWRLEAAHLIDTQDKSTWKEAGALSFSDWLKKRAEKEGIKISLLWRYLRVGRFATELKTGAWEKVLSPADIPENINADSIELLEKINRVVTDADFKTLAEDLYHKKIKRPQLLKTWQIYREALSPGQTARGRGTKRPVLDEKNEKKRRLSFQQEVLRWFAGADPTDLGYENGVSLRIVNRGSDRKKQLGYDAIFVACNALGIVDVTFIVFEEGGVDRHHAIASFKNDRIWLITQSNHPLGATSQELANYPKSWGVIGADVQGMHVLKKIPQNPPPMPLPVKELLLEFV